MKLVVFNGSPRRKGSNSKILIEQFLTGYHSGNEENTPVYYLGDKKTKAESLEAFLEADTVILIFPLYTDCMPGIVKEFFENLHELEFTGTKKIGFIVQSGFPEIKHSENLEKYLKKFSKRLDCTYLGTVIKGSVEGIQIMPPRMTNKLFSKFRALGEHFVIHGEFSEKIKMKLATPYRISFIKRMLFRFAGLFGITNFYWDLNLKKNGAFKKRFDRPFLD